MKEVFSGQEIVAAYTQFTFIDRSTPEGNASVENSKRLVDMLGKDFPVGKTRENSIFSEKYMTHVRNKLERLAPNLPSVKRGLNNFCDNQVSLFKDGQGKSKNDLYVEINKGMCELSNKMVAPLEIDFSEPQRTASTQKRGLFASLLQPRQ